MTIVTQRRIASDFSISAGMAAIIFFFVASTVVSYRNIHAISEESAQVARTHDTITALHELMSLMKDAETGQRGYVITGDEKYLQPYASALPRIEETQLRIDRLLNADQREQLPKTVLIRKHIDAKLAELQETIELRRTKGFEAAHAMVATDRGKEEMDFARTLAGEIEKFEYDIRQQRRDDMQKAFSFAIISAVGTGIFGVLLSGALGFMLQRASVTRRKKVWLQSGQIQLAKAALGELHLQQLGENILKLLAEYNGAQAGAFFFKQSGIYKRGATYGVPDNAKLPESFRLGEGLMGQAVKDGKMLIVPDVPDDYLYFGSSLGQSKPRHLVILPVTADGNVNAVIELGFMRETHPNTLELLEGASESIGVAVRSAAYRASLQDYLEETQRQSEELQSQSEELKVSNEELEEQSRMLKESQSRLEQQQAELEQTNSMLEEQTQTLESQKEDLERSRGAVQAKAQELEQASQYKSNFLANMSHELRTPLNSSLILAKLLADNPQGNLDDEQVRYAQTIQSSGNDLLSLINDILDLSKIEAGHMEIRPETIILSRVANDLKRMFEPIAKLKGLAFEATVAADCPNSIISDRQRVDQVLKNLLSNALKFTERGKVSVTISRSGTGMVAFAVRDTGIGIPKEQSEAIFDAFRQADGTISRKYGGTGLGLSISRELTRLLGGRITLESVPDQGSTFTLSLPEAFAGKTQRPAANAPRPSPTPLPTSRVSPATDDRDRLENGKRTILIVEDDISFAHILQDLVHELQFQCIVCGTAEEGLAAARQYMPNAVVLDVSLPDSSGLSVLDRLKHDTRTRHIPVHVISAQDHAKTALSLGAMGHLIKPVKREELSHALKRLEERFVQRMRRVLIVEDDKVQRESLSKLLGTSETQTVAVGTAAECMQKLKEGSFDCMVLDLSLPDASGYSLLESLSRQEDYSMPPVIVYTGRDLWADEEQRLRRYSHSIIIKGAKSPERLLDEVTLFLHQVVLDLPPEQQRMLAKAQSRDSALEGKHILVVEDDVRNVYAVTSILEPQGVKVHIARNGREALQILDDSHQTIDLVLMDVMMPEMDGLTATREIRKRPHGKKLPIIMLTAKAMKDDQERCLEAGASDYMAKPLDVDKLLSLVRVWIPR